MVYPDELHMDRFRRLFLVALGHAGVTEIGTMSAEITAGINELRSEPYHRMVFTIHTNVGVKSYGIAMARTVMVNETPLDSKQVHVGVTHLCYKTGIITLIFSDANNPALELFPEALPQGKQHV